MIKPDNFLVLACSRPKPIKPNHNSIQEIFCFIFFLFSESTDDTTEPKKKKKKKQTRSSISAKGNINCFKYIIVTVVSIMTFSIC